MDPEEVIDSLRGKVLEKEQKDDGLGHKMQWTPYNANMSMQGIKVNLKLLALNRISRNRRFD